MLVPLTYLQRFMYAETDLREVGLVQLRGQFAEPVSAVTCQQSDDEPTVLRTKCMRATAAHSAMLLCRCPIFAAVHVRSCYGQVCWSPIAVSLSFTYFACHSGMQMKNACIIKRSDLLYRNFSWTLARAGHARAATL